MGQRRGTLMLAVVICSALLLAVTGAAMAIDDERTAFVTNPAEDGLTPVAPADFDSTERLALSDPSPTPATGQVTMDPKVATSVSFSQLEGEYREITLRADMRQADTSQAEVAVVRAELQRIEAQLAQDISREQELYRALHAGEISGDEFYRELSMLHLRAELAESELDALSNALRGVIAPVTRDDAQRLRGEVSQAQLEAQTLQGPLTEQGAAVLLTQEQSMPPVEIRASDGGYVIASVHDGVYFRESLVSENRQRGAGGGFSDIETARSLTAELYPWTVSEAFESEDIPRGDIYSSTIDHPHGTTGIFIDGSTELAFRDTHELDLFSMPTVGALAVDDEGYSVIVERTYPGGPTNVLVLDEESNEPVSGATVVVNERAVGQTGSSGDLWFIAPAHQFELTVQTEDANVTHSIDFEEPAEDS